MAAIGNLLKSWRSVATSKKPFTVVLGNESGDLDSVVGSICLAFVLNNHPTLSLAPAVPALNFDPSDLPLRTDVYQFLKYHSVPSELLLTVEKSCKGTESFVDLEDQSIRVVLFDHNLLITSHKNCAERVVGIVDHHKNEEQYVETTKPLRIIKEIGSASTLVAGLCRDNGIPFPFPTFIAAPIIIDCENFDLTRNRATPEDIEVYKWLESLNGMKLDANQLYEQLKRWRKDIFSLTVEENLRRDFKSYDAKSVLIGFSSIPCSRVKFAKHYGPFTHKCIPFMSERHLKALFLTFAGTDNDGHQRDLVAIGKIEDINNFVSFAAGDKLFLKVEDGTTAEGFYWVSFRLTDTTMSRKKIAPIIRSTL